MSFKSLFMSLIAPGASWGLWFAATQAWIVKHSPELQADSFLLAVIVSGCAALAWVWKGSMVVFNMLATQRHKPIVKTRRKHKTFEPHSHDKN